MSEVVTYKGEIKEIYKEFNTIYPKVRAYCEDNKIEIDDDKYILDMLYSDSLEDKVFKVGDRLFELVSKQDMFESNIFQIQEKENGNYEYLVQYYDGGCSFEEAIGKAFIKNKI